MMQLALIDNIPIIPPKVTVRGKFKKWRYENNYRKGTKEKCCKNCTYCAGYTYGKRSFYKCNLQGISHCTSSDIAISYVCNNWKKEEGLCAYCKHLDCNKSGNFICDIDGEILQHEGEGRGCGSFEKYIEDMTE